jgi:hypothetical protein
LVTAHNSDGLRPLTTLTSEILEQQKRFLDTSRQGRHHYFAIVEAGLPSPRAKATDGLARQTYGGQARFRQKRGYREVSIMMV